MAHAVALSRRVLADRSADLLRTLVVAGCALALIAAARPFPF